MADWLPSTGKGRLAMARKWVEVLRDNAVVWGIPAAEYAQLVTLTGIAEQLQEQAENGDGNRVYIARASEGLDSVVVLMRRIHKRYALADLAGSDWIALDLTPPDTIPTTINAPTVQVEGDLTFPGIQLVEVRNMRPVGLVPGDTRAKWGFRIHYGILPFAGPDGLITHDGGKWRITEVPATGEQLPHSLFTRRRRHQFDFIGDRGKRVFICIRYENSKGEKGPFGPMLDAWIP